MNVYYEYLLLKKEEIKDFCFKLFGEEDELEDEDEEDEEGEEEEIEVEEWVFCWKNEVYVWRLRFNFYEEWDYYRKNGIFIGRIGFM